MGVPGRHGTGGTHARERLDDVAQTSAEHLEALCEANERSRFQSLASWQAESDSTRRVTNTHVCSADPARAREK
eukprot:COSAG06_NODE_8426_length_2178_cov_8.941151_1_plen_74_part_00